MRSRLLSSSNKLAFLKYTILLVSKPFSNISSVYTLANEKRGILVNPPIVLKKARESFEVVQDDNPW